MRIIFFIEKQCIMKFLGGGKVFYAVILCAFYASLLNRKSDLKISLLVLGYYFERIYKIIT